MGGALCLGLDTLKQLQAQTRARFAVDALLPECFFIKIVEGNA